MARSEGSRERHNEKFWRATLQRFTESGLSAAQFCRRHNLPLASLLAWQRILRLPQPTRSTQTTSTRQGTLGTCVAPRLPLFLPLKLPPATQTSLAQADGPTLEILLPNGLRLRLPADFDPERLRRLLTVLRGLPC